MNLWNPRAYSILSIEKQGFFGFSYHFKERTAAGVVRCKVGVSLMRQNEIVFEMRITTGIRLRQSKWTASFLYASEDFPRSISYLSTFSPRFTLLYFPAIWKQPDKLILYLQIIASFTGSSLMNNTLFDVIFASKQK